MTLTRSGLLFYTCLATLAACGGDDAAPTDVVGDTGTPCERDDVDEPEGALPLSSEGAAGYLCPVGDVDWYRFETGGADHLLRVKLAMDGDLSPVEPAYVVWSVDGAGAPAAVAAAAPPQRIGFPLDEVHCVAPGTYLVAVRDDGEDAQDFRRGYTLTMTSAADPDPSEPNDDAAGAAPLGATTVTGAIACVGDTDWYTFEAGPGQLARLRLEMPIGAFEPSLRLIDSEGTLVATRDNPSGSVRATDLVIETVLPRSGRYHVIVADDNGQHADPDVTYSVALTLVDDTDPNEPNGHPDTATPLDAATCGASWSPWREATGNIGAPGDNDWFVLTLAGCDPRGVIEAEVELLDAGLPNAERWALAARMQLAVTLARPHTGSPCDDDLDCQALTRTCDNDYDCSGLFNTCLPDGFCAGAGVCLPSNQCGANIVQRRFEPPTPPASPATTAPPPHRATASTPLFGDAIVFVRVADFQSDAGAPDVSYRLRVRVISEPDVNEPSNVYSPTLLQDFPVNIMADAGVAIPVLDCTDNGVDPPACCGPDTWIEGALSYENDLDFYTYEHPCPGEDCNLRIVYELDGGPVDFVLSVYQGNSLWFGGVVGASDELATQAADSGAYGGTSSCFYAFQGHEGEPYRYHVGIRDLAEVRDWSPDQSYRFCVERTSRACVTPCRLYENGCGQP